MRRTTATAVAIIHHCRWNVPSPPSAWRASELSITLSQVTLLSSFLPLDFVTSSGKVTDTEIFIPPEVPGEVGRESSLPSLLSASGDRSKTYFPPWCLIVQMSVCKLLRGTDLAVIWHAGWPLWDVKV